MVHRSGLAENPMLRDGDFGDAGDLRNASAARIITPMFSVPTFLIETAYAQPANLAIHSTCTSIFTTGMGVPGQGWNCIAVYIGMLTFTIIGFAASLSLVMLIINGFRYMIGPALPGGSSDAAKKGIGAALFGLAMALLVYILLDTLITSVTQ
jgi:hypothetical protein